MKSEQESDNNQMAEWQKISGLTPANEKSMSADARDAAIRKLIAEVEVRARAEFARGETVPKGERTVFWDPLERICMQLEISRVKLSALSRELTGLRAHELTDRIKARTLPTLVQKRLLKVLVMELEAMRKTFDRSRAQDAAYVTGAVMRLWKLVKQEHSGVFRMRWAMDLGFPNPSRLQKACLLAFGISIEEMEARLIQDIVQKIFCERTEEQPQRTQRAQREEKGGDEIESAPNSVADAIIKEAVDGVMRGRGVA